jgi:hypothetical protein
MPSLLDYAVLSAAVYNDVRQGKNQVSVPAVWTQIDVQPSTLGFAAAAYQNANGDIVTPITKGTGVDLFLTS